MAIVLTGGAGGAGAAIAAASGGLVADKRGLVQPFQAGEVPAEHPPGEDAQALVGPSNELLARPFVSLLKTVLALGKPGGSGRLPFMAPGP